MFFKDLIFLDSGVLLNILASKEAAALLTEGSSRYAIESEASAETYRLWPTDNEAGDEEQITVGASESLAEGTLGTYIADRQRPEFINLAISASDTCAALLTCVLTHNAQLATDDKLTRRVIQEFNLPIPLHSTLSIVHAWQIATGSSAEAVRMLIRAITYQSQFTPLDDDPLYTWWHENLEGHNRIT